MSKEVRLYLEGMYCRECKDVISSALRNTTGVIKVDVSYAKACANILYDENNIKVEKIKEVIENTGYSVLESRKDIWKMQITSIAIIGILVCLFKHFFSHGMMTSINETMTYGMIFIVGITASFHCISMCGGIMLTQTAMPDKMIADNKIKAIVPAAFYNVGRVLSYTLMGAIVGAVGSVITVKPSAKGIIFIVIGLFMVLMSLQMMNIIPRLEKVPFRLPQSCSLPQSIRSRYSTKPLIIGLLTGLMPCGQLQSMQLYALSTGSAVSGAISMFIFSIGTVPIMLLLGSLSAYASKKFQKYMVRISGITIAALSILLILKGVMINHHNM